jgi:hypothetical protein
VVFCEKYHNWSALRVLPVKKIRISWKLPEQYGTETALSRRMFAFELSDLSCPGRD